jgi:hypothetical protein
VHHEAEGSAEVGFKGGDIDLAVALGGMPVAGLEQRALDRDANGGALSIFPPAGATPMLPKKGRSGIRMPGAKFAIIFWRSSAMIFERL